MAFPSKVSIDLKPIRIGEQTLIQATMTAENISVKTSNVSVMKAVISVIKYFQTEYNKIAIQGGIE